MKSLAAALAVAALALAVAGCGFSSEDQDAGSGATIKWYVFNEPGGAFEQAIDTCNKQAGGRYTIQYVRLPTDADQQRELVARRLAAEDTDIDIIGMDVIWTAEFAEAGWILPWEGARAQRAVAGKLRGPRSLPSRARRARSPVHSLIQPASANSAVQFTSIPTMSMSESSAARRRATSSRCWSAFVGRRT